MRDWIPVPGTTKARLLEAALAAFATHGYDAVAVTAIAAEAGVTVGSLYHHFGGKPQLYALVRTDVERRVLDRIEGAWTASGRLDDALSVGLDYLRERGFTRLLGELRPTDSDDDAKDPVGGFLAEHRDAATARLLAAAWRAALRDPDPVGARDALRRLAASA